MKKMLIKSSQISLFMFAFTSCGKQFEFEATDKDTTFERKLSYAEIGDPSRVTRTYVSFWNDTIIIDGIKTAPTKDTIRNTYTADYYGLDTMVIYEKYKATKWYIKEVYQFSPW
jgi:hypothetical protein